MLTSQRITWVCLVGGCILPRLFIISNRRYCHGKLNNDINLTLELTIFLAKEIKHCWCLVQGACGMAFLGFSFPFGISWSFWCVIYESVTCDRVTPTKNWWTLHNLHLLCSLCHSLTVVMWSGVLWTETMGVLKTVWIPVNKQYSFEGSQNFIWNNTWCLQVIETLFKGFVFILSLSSPTQNLKFTGFIPYIYHPCCHAIW